MTYLEILDEIFQFVPLAEILLSALIGMLDTVGQSPQNLLQRLICLLQEHGVIASR